MEWVGWERGGGGGVGGDLKICQVFVFKQKIYCLFLQMERVGGHTTDQIIGLNILKLQPIQLLETAVSS